MANKFSFNPITSQLDLVTDTSDLAKLAIPTTQNNLYTNLIPNNLLIPNQWYLITDFRGTYAIPNTSPIEYHTGLVANFYNQYNNAVQQYYDDGVTPIVDGDPEQIYVLASSANTIYPIGHSKTFSNEQITFKQDVPPVTEEGYLYIQGYENTEYYMSGDGSNGDGSLANYESGLTIDSVIDSSNIIIGGTGKDFIPNRIMNGSFSMDIYDGNGTELYCNDSNEGVDWSYDVSTNTLTDLTGTMDFTTLGYGGYWNGYMLYQGSYTGSVTYPPFYGGTSDTYITDIIDASNIVIGGNPSHIINHVMDGSFYITFYNDATGEYLNCTDSNKNIDWDFNPMTNVLTNLQNTYTYDFTKLSSNYCYVNSDYYFVTATFQGQIIARNNLKLGFEEKCDWRSQQFDRYKVLATTWVAGTSTKGTLYRYNNYLFICVRQTTTSPADYSPYWLRISDDLYYFSSAFTVNSTYIQLDTTSKIRTMAFNVENFRTFTTPVNSVVNNVNPYTAFDCVIFSNISQITNAKIAGSQTSIYGSVQDSTLSLINFVLGSCSYFNLYAGGQGILVDGNNSTVYQLYTSVFRGIYKSQGFQLNGSLINQLAFSTIYTMNYTVVPNGLIQSTTANILNYTYCAGYILNNIIANLTNCNFYDLGSGSVFANFITSSVQDTNVTGSFVGNNIYGETRFINVSGSITNNTFWNNVFTINQAGDTAYANPLAITITGCTLRGGINNWRGFGSAYISGTEIDNGSYDLDFRNGGSTTISGCKLYNLRNTSFATYGAVSWNSLTTYSDSYSNNFHAMAVSNCRIGAFFNNSFGGTSGKYLNLYNSTIYANINSCNADYVVVGAIQALGIFSLQVSGGDANTRIIGGQYSGSLGPVTMTVGSQLTSVVANGIFQNIVLASGARIDGLNTNGTTAGINIAANGYLSASVTNGYTNITIAASKTVSQMISNGLNGFTANHNVSGCTFLVYMSGQTTSADITNLLFNGTLANAFITDFNGYMYPVGSSRFGAVSTDVFNFFGRMVVRTLATNPLDATPANRPAGTLKEIGYYSGKQYVCVNSSTPVWEMLQTNSLAKFGDITGGNYTGFEADGTMILNGTATTYDDIQFGISSGKVPASNAPTWATWNGLSEYSFGIGDYIDLGSQEFKHDWKEGSPVELHIHWSTGTGNYVNGDKVNWQIEYTWTNMATSQPFTVFPAPTAVTAEQAFTTTVLPYSHVYTSVVAFTPTGGKIGAQLKVRLKRIAKSAGGTDPATNPFALQVGLHYEQDTLGSRTTSSK